MTAIAQRGSAVDNLERALGIVCGVTVPLAFAALTITLAGLALRECRRTEADPGERFGWAVIILVPVVGPALYLLVRRPQRRRLIDPRLPPEVWPGDLPPGPAVGAHPPDLPQQDAHHQQRPED